MNIEQYLGPLRAAIPLGTAILVGWGMDDATAGVIAGGVAMVAAGLWSWFSNRQVAVASQTVKASPGVEVVVGPTAPPAMKQAAADPAVVGIVPTKR